MANGGYIPGTRTQSQCTLKDTRGTRKSARPAEEEVREESFRPRPAPSAQLRGVPCVRGRRAVSRAALIKTFVTPSAASASGSQAGPFWSCSGRALFLHVRLSLSRLC